MAEPAITRMGDTVQIGDDIRVEPLLGTHKFKVLQLGDGPDAVWQPEPTLYDSEEAAIAAVVGT